MKSFLAPLAAISIAAIAVPAHAAVLFEENWSDTAVNANPSTNGRWEQAVGDNSHLKIVENPLPELGGKWLTVAHNAALGALPTMASTDTFSLPEEGLSLSLDIAVTDLTDNGYIRFGIYNPKHGMYSNTYFFQIHGTYAKLTRVYPTSTLTDVARVDFTSGARVTDEAGNFAMTMTQDESGNVTVKLLLNGNEILSYIDAGNTAPSFEEGFKVFMGFRDPRVAYVSNITLDAIPEGSTYAMLLGGAGLLWGAKQYRRSRQLRR